MRDKINGIIEKKVPLTYLIGIAFAIIAWGLSLEHRVGAHEDFIDNHNKENKEILMRVRNIEDNQLRIMDRFGIEPVHN